MKKTKTELIANGRSVQMMKVDGEDYICLTDIARQKNPEFPADVVRNWMRSKMTVAFLGLWEQLHNPNFKLVEFDQFKNEAGLNSFFGMAHQQWQAANPTLKGNQRDYATINQLICISNMENINAVMINDGIPQPQRLKKLNEIAIQQMRILSEVDNRKYLK